MIRRLPFVLQVQNQNQIPSPQLNLKQMLKIANIEAKSMPFVEVKREAGTKVLASQLLRIVRQDWWLSAR